MTDLPELMRDYADYMETVTDFVGSPDAIARALREGADKIERLRTALHGAVVFFEEATEYEATHPFEYGRPLEAREVDKGEAP